MNPGTAQSRLAELLVENQRVRARGSSPPDFAARLAQLQQFQARRLAATYSDLRSQARYQAAVEFFLKDLYGPHDFADRDADLLRVHKVMERLLPARARRALELAIELEVLSQRLDLAVAEALEPGPIDAQRYAAAYRRAGQREARERQIELIGINGRYLDEVVQRPIIHRLVHLARGPAHAAGFGALQEFLERGFDAFRTMGGAEDFLATVSARETQIMQRLLAGTADPFAVEPGPADSR